MSKSQPPQVRTVVGAAIIRDGRVLACRRTSPPKAAGLWEFPGGKVEPGEGPEQALVREIAEELQLDIEITGWLDGASAIGTTHQLLVATASASAGRPQPTEHDAITWLGADELDDVEWLEPDLPFLWQLGELLRGSGGA
ncbi:(deoxy)nucleoside triphosphate pyrophosphohydrolase [Nocardioides sp.]|uniref:(deoxy)nucleoside triphosphate pyrophosphohydrolase n=1 Tax=Nocardioides sp. TaxID=35761 RepID=UPI002B26D2D0|nr:(deoxy)nucleoside triphosphate pyrophosphohydrolase [Nocardioides sp.]